MLAVVKIRHDPPAAVYIAKHASLARPTRKRSAVSNASSSAASITSSRSPTASPTPTPDDLERFVSRVRYELERTGLAV
jgi:hypothetical protein